MSQRTGRTVYAFGFAIYAFSFFLPAVQQAGMKPFDGWLCAMGVLIGAFQWPLQLSLVLMGLLNPLVLLQIATGMLAPGRWFSLAQSSLILAGIGACWWHLFHDKMTILAGHSIWIVGILLILVPELVRRAMGQTPARK
jgi:hypothetical protein